MHGSEGGTLSGGLIGSAAGAAIGKKLAASVCSVGMKFLGRGNGSFGLVCSVLFEGAGALGEVLPRVFMAANSARLCMSRK